ncbi:hypothetical protein [Streptomyces mirabilis]|uniref:hypothetical protein n=1 Tax=Streptomyces mirabilis TaxID=68239 RepID=UPI0033B0BE4A
MPSLEQIAVPAQDCVRADQQQEVPQLVHREVVEQAGEHRAVGIGEGGPFQWKFTTSDLDDLLARLDRHTTDHQEESSVALAA